MTLLDVEEATAPSSRPVTTSREVWRAARTPAVIALLVVAIGVLVAMVGGETTTGRLYPDSAGPEGGRALASLLRDRGIAVGRTAFFSGTTAQTVFVPDPSLVDPDDLTNVARIGAPAHVVLVAPTDEELDQLQLPWLQIRAVSHPDVRDTEPGCALPEATTAGVAKTGGTGYLTDDTLADCYARGGHASLAVFERDGLRVTVVGTGAPFTNELLGQQGNAALALGLLSQHDRVEWLQPRLSELYGDDEGDSLVSLLPGGVRWGVLQLLVAALFAVVWRARRLGPVVTEPLPVVVRAAEAVEGRARLYQAGRARERAAAALRDAVRQRLARALGLAADADRAAVVPVVAARSRRQAPDVDLLLYGPAPADDDALVRLAGELDSLDREVHQ